MNQEFIFSRLMDRIENLESQVNSLHRKMNNTLREGRVKEVDGGSGMAIVDAQGIETTQIPWLQRSGSIQDWDPPAVGERIILLSPNGDPGRGLILPGGYSDQYSQPHNKLGEAFRKTGETKRTQKPDQYYLETPHHLVESPSIDFGGTGGPPVARKGDLVHVKFGSSAGYHPIVTGSDITRSK